MATPLISGDRQSQDFLAEQFRRQHQYSLFAWHQRMTKAEAHAEAWRRLMAERERQMMLQRLRQQAANSTIR